MKIGHRARIYPSVTQQQALEVCFGHARFVYNQYIAWREWEYERGFSEDRLTFSQMRSVLTSKNKTAFPWLKDVSSIILQEAVRSADNNYWQMIRNRASGKKSRTPYHSKRAEQSFRLTGSGVKMKVSNLRKRRFLLYIPKVGWVSVRAGRDISLASSVVVKRDKAGRYWASFTIDMEQRESQTGPAIGVDLGLKDFAVFISSEGQRGKIPAPKIYRDGEKDIARATRALSKKKKGSKNRAKARVRLARVHNTVANRRADFLHKLSFRLTNENQIVCRETLSIAGMARFLGKDIYDASWAKFNAQLDYKSVLYGSNIISIDRFYPSSKLCSQCGYIYDNLTLADRSWVCESCGTHLDRDYNAALNILDAAGHAESLNACGEDVRRALVCADLAEAGTHRSARRQGKGRKSLAALTPEGRSRKLLP